MKYPWRPWSVGQYGTIVNSCSVANIMVSRSHERIVSKVAANVSLNHFPTDTIARNKVLVLALRAWIIVTSRHCSEEITKKD